LEKATRISVLRNPESRFSSRISLFQKVEAMPEDQHPDAKSGDGTVANVGVKMTDAPVQCPVCRQRFKDQKSLALHKKFIHDSKDEG